MTAHVDSSDVYPTPTHEGIPTSLSPIRSWQVAVVLVVVVVVGCDRRAAARRRVRCLAPAQLLPVLVDVRVALTEFWDWLLRTDLSDCHDRADHRDCPDNTENIDWKLPNDPIDMADQALPIDANEPTEPIDPNEAVDPIDSTEFFEPIDSHDPPSAMSERRAESRSACTTNGQSGRRVTGRG